MTVITLPTRRTEVPQERVKQILATLDIDLSHALLNCEHEEGTGKPLVSTADKPLFDAVFSAFMVPTPDGGLEMLIHAVSYLGKLARAVRLRQEDPAAYRTSHAQLAKLEQQFIDSLFQDDTSKPPALIKRIFDTKLRSGAFNI